MNSVNLSQKHRTLMAIPCYNEEYNLPALFADLRQQKVLEKFDVCFVDDCSSDTTAQMIKDHGFRVFSHEENRGYGGAVKTAFKLAILDNYDSLVIFPGDHQRKAVDAIALVQMLQDRHIDVAVGSKFHIYSDKYGPVGRRIGNRIFAFIAKTMWGSPIQDVLSGFKAYRISSMEPILHYLPEDYGLDIVLSLICSRFGLRIEETPVACRYDEHTTKMKSIILVSMKLLYRAMRAYVMVPREPRLPSVSQNAIEKA